MNPGLDSRKATSLSALLARGLFRARHEEPLRHEISLDSCSVRILDITHGSRAGAPPTPACFSSDDELGDLDRTNDAMKNAPSEPHRQTHRRTDRPTDRQTESQITQTSQSSVKEGTLREELDGVLKPVFRSAVSLYWTQSCWLQTGSSSVLISAEVEGLRIGVFNGVLLVEMFVAESQSSSFVVAW